VQKSNFEAAGAQKMDFEMIMSDELSMMAICDMPSACVAKAQDNVKEKSGDAQVFMNIVGSSMQGIVPVSDTLSEKNDK